MVDNQELTSKELEAHKEGDLSDKQNYIELQEYCPKCRGRLIQNNKGIECGELRCYWRK